MRVGNGLHDEEIYCLYRSSNVVKIIKSRILRWKIHVARMEEVLSKFQKVNLYIRDLEEYRRWEDNIRVDLKEIGVNRRNWIDFARHRDYLSALVNVSLNLLVP